MQVEYEEFETIEDMFMYISSIILPIKNTISVNSYKGYIISFTPLGGAQNDSYLMVYACGSLEPGIYEFDMSTRKYARVERVERADKIYIVVLTPKRNTLADTAIANMTQ